MSVKLPRNLEYGRDGVIMFENLKLLELADGSLVILGNNKLDIELFMLTNMVKDVFPF